MTTEDYSADDVVKDGVLRVGPFVGLISRESTVAEVGSAYCREFEVRALADSENGKSNYFFIGPVPPDAQRRVVEWWTQQKPIKTYEKAALTLKYRRERRRFVLEYLGIEHPLRPPATARGLLRAKFYKAVRAPKDLLIVRLSGSNWKV